MSNTDANATISAFRGGRSFRSDSQPPDLRPTDPELTVDGKVLEAGVVNENEVGAAAGFTWSGSATWTRVARSIALITISKAS
jgi:hypothetical protein